MSQAISLLQKSRWRRCMDRGLRGFLDYTDYPTAPHNRSGLRANCILRTT